MQRKGLLKGKTDKINGWGYYINEPGHWSHKLIFPFQLEYTFFRVN